MESNGLISGGKKDSINFGDYTLLAKTKVSDFPIAGDLYNVKSFSEITRLEKNGMFLYESVPGTKVENFIETDRGITFVVEGTSDAQITVGLMEEVYYEVFVDGFSVGNMMTNLGGKLTVSVELTEGKHVEVKIQK